MTSRDEREALVKLTLADVQRIKKIGLVSYCSHDSAEVDRLHDELCDLAIAALTAPDLQAYEECAGWLPIESAPKSPCGVSPQSDFHLGLKHGPVILLAFKGEGCGEKRF